MKSHPISLFLSCSTPIKRSSALILWAILTISNLTQAAPCLNDLAGFTGGNICTAKDVKLSAGTFTVISGPATCVAGETILVQLQADLEATAQDRYNIGIWVAQDGGNALTGVCYDDYLKPLLSLAPVPVMGIVTSPFLEDNVPPDIINGCGDIDKTLITRRNIGGTTAPGPVGPPATISIICQDTVQQDPMNPGGFVIGSDGFADVSACLSWSNDRNVNPPSNPACTSQAGTVPSTKSMCNCAIAKPLI
jgi:hypothetical protein